MLAIEACVRAYGLALLVLQGPEEARVDAAQLDQQPVELDLAQHQRQRAGADQRAAFHHGEVHDHRAHADEGAVLDRAGMQQRHVADGDVLADQAG
ncbi:MAG: hypothetical protein KDF63_00340, partial [Rhodoferax sp.]|nr:hypothetical protein [Rhodoferax sp.]